MFPDCTCCRITALRRSVATMARMEDIFAVTHPDGSGVTFRLCAKHRNVDRVPELGVSVGNRVLWIEVVILIE